ncbi:nuclease-related domain-containing protein [Bradyrhizobium vignae]|uniref:NERD domain-containing protein n=1 Tax=Bradyrhizobium vignae TaxID=1549949 RepID=A0A2U3PV56_9BRAD|nr:nuclease-related domain-containing protein [Bradyrhizobium vignae]SPP93035.1 protein of unknown function [Bradyrhizobium vignae]
MVNFGICRTSGTPTRISRSSSGPGQYREIDAVMVIDDRILLVDLKDWKQRITCDDGRWFHGKLDMGSPVGKIRSTAHKVLEAFRAHLREYNEKNVDAGPKLRPPMIQGIVIQCGPASLDGLGIPSFFIVVSQLSGNERPG